MAATQIPNAGCRATLIQRLLGQKELKTPTIYARVHDRTMADDYNSSMEQVERCLDVLEMPLAPRDPLGEGDRRVLLGLAAELAEAELSEKRRLDIAAQIQMLLGGVEAWSRPISVLARDALALA